MLLMLPFKAILYKTDFFNGILYTTCFRMEWKVSQMIMLPKATQTGTWGVFVLANVFYPFWLEFWENFSSEAGLRSILKHVRVISGHQFGFRGGQSTIKQTYRLVKVISKCLEEKNTVRLPSWTFSRPLTRSGFWLILQVKKDLTSTELIGSA